MVISRADESITAQDDFEPIESVDLVGGTLCFDFVNTASGRQRGPLRDRLEEYADLIVWGRRVGLVDDGRAARLETEAARRRAEADRVLDLARSLREAIYRIFSAVSAGITPADDAVDVLNAALSESGRLRRLVVERTGWSWVWDEGEDPLSWPLHGIAESAGDLLIEGEPKRIKECGGENCNWLFYDASRNRSRRWCDMKDCGNRAKQRRHRRRAGARR